LKKQYQLELPAFFSTEWYKHNSRHIFITVGKETIQKIWERNQKPK
jgi:hypothetical protein